MTASKLRKRGYTSDLNTIGQALKDGRKVEFLYDNLVYTMKTNLDDETAPWISEVFRKDGKTLEYSENYTSLDEMLEMMEPMLESSDFFVYIYKKTEKDSEDSTDQEEIVAEDKESNDMDDEENTQPEQKVEKVATVTKTELLTSAVIEATSSDSKIDEICQILLDAKRGDLIPHLMKRIGSKSRTIKEVDYSKQRTSMKDAWALVKAGKAADIGHAIKIVTGHAKPLE